MVKSKICVCGVQGAWFRCRLQGLWPVGCGGLSFGSLRYVGYRDSGQGLAMRTRSW